MLATAKTRHETFGLRQEYAACITYAWRVDGLNARGQKIFLLNPYRYIDTQGRGVHDPDEPAFAGRQARPPAGGGYLLRVRNLARKELYNLPAGRQVFMRGACPDVSSGLNCFGGACPALRGRPFTNLHKKFFGAGFPYSCLFHLPPGWPVPSFLGRQRHSPAKRRDETFGQALVCRVGGTACTMCVAAELAKAIGIEAPMF